MANPSEIPSHLRTIEPSVFTSEKDRKLALVEARNLVNRLETPVETGLRYGWIFPARMACIKVSMQLELFTKWVELGSGEPKTEEELFVLIADGGKGKGCDRELFARILGALAGNQVLDVRKPGVFSLTPFASALGSGPEIPAMMDMFFELNGPGCLHLASYLSKRDYRNPTAGDEDDLVKHMFGQTLWPHISARPELEAMVANAMAANAKSRPKLSDLYPTEKLIQEKEGIVLVDCGGGVGHDTAAFATKHPQAVDRLVLQDRPSVIEQVQNPLIRTKMAYDFLLDSQPIQGAAGYYFHFVFHDWADVDCKKILSNLKSAMKKGHSKLLVHDVVLDPLQPEALSTMSDITMLMMTAGKERTTQQWTELLEGEGFKINRVYSLPTASESLIEAELV